MKKLGILIINLLSASLIGNDHSSHIYQTGNNNSAVVRQSR